MSVTTEQDEEKKAGTMVSRKFIAGNPNAEIIQGKLRLFRGDELADGQLLNDEQQLESNFACILNVPSYMSAADLLHFLSPFTDSICQVRIVSDGGGQQQQQQQQQQEEADEQEAESALKGKAISDTATAGKTTRGPDSAKTDLVEERRHVGAAFASSAHYLVLLKLRSAKETRDFVAAYSGRKFNSMEPDCCVVLFLTGVDFIRGSGEHLFPASAAAVGSEDDGEAAAAAADRALLSLPEKLTEVPSCPVCLERLDESVGGVLTILCNHAVHCQCFQRWSSASKESRAVCPICRYVQHPGNDSDSGRPRCSVCNSDDQLWICLICGDVGCGRYSRRHALQHYQRTRHSFSLELNTGRVWDYAGDCYVHRLIQETAQGKTIGLNAIQREGGSGRGGLAAGAGSTTGASSSSSSSSSPLLDEISVYQKVDDEYNYLITTQLESQRLYFKQKLESALAKQQLAEDQLFEVTAQLSRKANESSSTKSKASSSSTLPHSSSTTSNPSSSSSSSSSSSARAAATETLRRTYEAQMRKLVAERKHLKDELRFLTNINESLEANQVEYRSREASLKDRVAELEEENRDLMAFVENREAAAGGDLILTEKMNKGKKRGKRRG